MNKSQELCADCEVFKNHTSGAFAWGFFCPLNDAFVKRDDPVCEWVVNDNLPF